MKSSYKLCTISAAYLLFSPVSIEAKSNVSDVYMTQEIREYAQGGLYDLAFMFSAIDPQKYECLHALAANEQYINERLVAASQKFSKYKEAVAQTNRLYQVLHTKAGNVYLEKYLTEAKTTDVEERKKLRKQGNGGAALDPNFKGITNAFAQQLLYSGSKVLASYRKKEPACASTLNRK